MTIIRRTARVLGAVIYLWLGLAGSQASAASERVALLIGNSDYNKNGQVDLTDPPAGMLPDLPNACKDVEAVEAKLMLLGWTEDEITRTCDEKKSEIVGQLDTFIEKFNNMENPTGFLYFAGHGIQINDVAYVFGVNSLVDIKGTADTMVRKPKNTLFISSGIDIARYLKSNVGDVYGGALVVVLDACRDNPVATVLRSNNRSIPITAPKPSADMMGMIIAYSTTAGAFANDGLGELSPYAESLVASMGDDLSIDEAISKAAFSLYNKSNGNQQPSKEGIFPPPPPRRCFAKSCVGAVPAPPSGSGAMAPPPPMELRTRGGPGYRLAMTAKPQDMGGRVISRSDAPAMQIRGKTARLSVEKTEVFRASKAMATMNIIGSVDNRILVDVFYCSGYPVSDGLKAAAEQAVERIRAYATGREGSQLIKSIRLREHPRSYNDLQGSRFIRNLIVFDSSSDLEIKLAQALASVVGAPFASIKNIDYSRGYLKLYACDGASPNASASRIFFHVANSTTYPLARNVMQEMSLRFPGINIAGGVEMLPRQSPATSEVRYFHQEDAVLASDIASQIGQTWSVPIQAKFVAGFKVSPLTMEVWFGRQVMGCQASSNVPNRSGCSYLPPKAM